MKLFIFFSKVFGVRIRFLIDDYCIFWKEWENLRLIILYEECYVFWRYVILYLSGKIEKMMLECVIKIFVVFDKLGDIYLINK